MGETSDYPILEIYHPSISIGDATIIVSRDNKKEIAFIVLIDLGSNPSEIIIWSQANIAGFATAEKGLSKTKNSTFDYVIVSHYHTDHYAGVNYNSIKTENFISSYVSDMEAVANHKRDYSNEKVTNSIKLTKLETSERHNVFEHIIKGEDFDINLSPPEMKGFEKSIRLNCICANGIYKNSENKFVIHKGNFGNWNDHSIAWLLEYQSEKKVFRYFTAGDLSGGDNGPYTDIESQLIPYLKNVEVDVLKATHHGSKHSLTEKFLKTIKPKTIIVPCNNGHLLPFPQFFERVGKLNLIPDIFIVNYMDFNIQSYQGKLDKKEKSGITLLTQLINDKKIKTPITTDETSYFIVRKDKSDSLAELPVYSTTVQGTEHETKYFGKIKLKITAPSNRKDNLPELYANLEFATEVFNLIAKHSEQPNLDFDKYYTLNGSTYQQKDGVDSKIQKKLAQSFRQLFAPIGEEKRTIEINFLSNPNVYNNRFKRKNRSDDFLDDQESERKLTKSSNDDLSYEKLRKITLSITKKNE